MQGASVSRPPAAVLWNAAAGPRGAQARFAAAQGEIDRRFAATVIRMDRDGNWRREIGKAIAAGVRTFIAAGGDGTVHVLVEALATADPRVPLDVFTLGAVGLGSSNDFEKPVPEKRKRPGAAPDSLAQSPRFLLDAGSASPRDVVRVTWKDAAGLDTWSVLVVSGSIGLVAEGNARFQKGWLRQVSTGLAITAAALMAIARHQPFPARVRYSGGECQVSLSSLSVLKSPWLSGSLRYDVPVSQDDGLLVGALCAGMSRGQLLETLIGLSSGRFCGRPGTFVFQSPWIEIESPRPFFLELDGEVTQAGVVRFELFPGRIRVCG